MRIQIFNTNFYPRSPCGERPSFLDIDYYKTRISIHALLAESDVSIIELIEGGLVFLSTLSLRRATQRFESAQGHRNHFYPRSPCGERLALLTPPTRKPDFYPRSPCGERHGSPVRSSHDFNFYPRSPCGERRVARTPTTVLTHFYPRSPCGERRPEYFLA